MKSEMYIYDKIICNDCNCLQTARILRSDIGKNYFHTCEFCGVVINKLNWCSIRNATKSEIYWFNFNKLFHPINEYERFELFMAVMAGIAIAVCAFRFLS